MAYKELRFTFLDVLQLTGSRFTPQRDHGEVQTICPICGGKKFNINLDKGMGQCMYESCPSKNGRSGGMNAKTFYAAWKGVSTDEAYHEIMQSLGLERRRDGSFQERKERIVYERPQEAERATVKVLDNTYSLFLEELTLEKEDMDDLVSRGFDPETVADLGYKTFPSKDKTDFFALCKKLLRNGAELKGVPGFFQAKTGSWTFSQVTQGVIMPCRDRENRIVALQIRKRNSLRKVMDGELEEKCAWFSSKGKRSGCSSGAPVHYACEWIWKNAQFVPHFKTKEGAPVQIALTEGIMKADLFHQFRPDIQVISVPGVNATKQLKDNLVFLKGIGVQMVYNAYDQDYRTNKNVYAALEKTRQIIEEIGLGYKHGKWTTTILVNGKEVDCLKGIDDYLAYKMAGIIPKIEAKEV